MVQPPVHQPGAAKDEHIWCVVEQCRLLFDLSQRQPTYQDG